MLTAKALKVGFLHKRVETVLIDQLDFETSKGALTAIIGRNGTGKTTLLRTLAGLHKPLSGNVLLAGKSLEAYKNAEKARQMAFVNTSRFSLGYFLVEDLVALGRHPYTGFMGFLSDEDKAVIESAFESTGIHDLRKKTIGQLSDGEHQKVMIARAIAQSAPLMLLDEPTAHLDLINRVEIFKMLKKLTQEQGNTILVCTHEIEAALSVADEIILLDGNGKTIINTPESLIESGDLESVFMHESVEFDKATRRFRF